VLIDGFNLYHAIDDCPHFHEFKWLDPMRLAQAYVHPTKEALIGVFFYTAVPTWNDEKRARHNRLLAIYEDLGVQVKRGRFLPTTATCRVCGKEYGTFQEKETDINIALEMMRLGNDDLADRIVLVTGDNDQASSVRSFRELTKKPQVTLVLPPFRQAEALKGVCTESKSLTGFHLRKMKLDNPYHFKKTQRELVVPPDKWSNAKNPPDGWRPRETGRSGCH
jgi:uncharacterized LabA/DUF88 family protein